MIFGIDLGTTNSLIGRGDTLVTGLVSSAVNLKSNSQVARDEYGDGVYSSYKVDMSTSDDGKLPILASSIILKKLASLVAVNFGAVLSEVIISVPASFTTIQRQAVYEAGKKAGLYVKGLINEPTAAAIYACCNQPNLVVVYDLGGGTFDISIVDNRSGAYTVVAFDGCILGGDNLDSYLTEKVMSNKSVPIRLRTKDNKTLLKYACRKAKEEIQRTHCDATIIVDNSEFHIEDTLTVEDYKSALHVVFGKTITMTNYLIDKYISQSESPKLVFVGGSSICPYLQEMVNLACGIPVLETDAQGDFIVAKGVAKYAKMVEDGIAYDIVEDVTKRLSVEMIDGRTKTILDSNSIIPCSSVVSVTNPKPTRRLEICLCQGNNIMACDNDYIGTLGFDYGREVDTEEGQVEVKVSVGVDGIITLSAYEMLFGEDTAQEIKLKLTKE